MRLIEKKNDSIGCTVDNGALINYIACNKQSGALSGFNITLSGTEVKVSAGTLSVHGFTLEAQDETLIDLATVAVDNSQERVLTIQVSYDKALRDSSYQLKVALKSEEYALPNDNIENGITGTCSYVLCEFSKVGSTIPTFKSRVNTIDVSAGGRSSSGVASVPQPLIGVETSKTLKSGVKGLYHGNIILTNGIDYRGYTNNYTLTLCFVRYLNGAKTSRGSKYVRTTRASVAYFNALKDGVEFDSVPLNSLLNAMTDNSVLDIGVSIKAIIDQFFYDDTNLIGNAKTGMVGITSRPKVELGVTPFKHCRATRSRVYRTRGAGGNKYKYNYVKFAYKVILQNNQGTVVGESPLSNAITILPTAQGQDKSTTFRIKND